MKRVMQLPIGFLVPSGLAVLLFIGCGENREHVGPEEERPAKRAHLTRTSNGENVVVMDTETRKRAGLVVAAASAARLHPEVKAYGKALDPASLVAMDGAVREAEAALTQSAAQLKRTRTLYEGEQNASRRALEAAEADFKADEVRAKVAQSNLNLEWGEGIAGLGAAERAMLLEQLLNRRTSLLRVDVPLGEGNLRDIPSTARISVAGVEEKFFDARVLSLAPKVNEKAPGRGFLLRVEGEDASIRPGSAVSAFLPVSGEAHTGVIIPRRALVRFMGKAWVYVQIAADGFARRQVSLISPTEEGWFLEDKVQPGEKLVVGGAEALLSEELRSQIHIGD